MRLDRAVSEVARGRLHPGRCPLCGPTVFRVHGPWLRDEYRCRRCGSIPRQRALVDVLRREVPDLRRKRVFESSPGGVSSGWLARHCAEYTPSQYFDDVPRGQSRDGVRSEDLQALTLPSGTVDVFVTQDVLEHVVHPEAALAEIARVLAPGGVHVWTVPVFPGRRTVRRAEDDGQGGVRHLLPPDYHGNPLGGRSLVIHEWGDDLLELANGTPGVVTTRHARPSWLKGIRGEMIDVFVTRKGPAAAS